MVDEVDTFHGSLGKGNHLSHRHTTLWIGQHRTQLDVRACDLQFRAYPRHGRLEMELSGTDFRTHDGEFKPDSSALKLPVEFRKLQGQ